MRFMLLQNYGEVESGAPPMTEWTPEDGDTETAIVEFHAAAARTMNAREQHYLTIKAARLATEPEGR